MRELEKADIKAHPRIDALHYTVPQTAPKQNVKEELDDT
jgi:hypothetical protein